MERRLTFFGNLLYYFLVILTVNLLSAYNEASILSKLILPVLVVFIWDKVMKRFMFEKVFYYRIVTNLEKIVTGLGTLAVTCLLISSTMDLAAVVYISIYWLGAVIIDRLFKKADDSSYPTAVFHKLHP